MTLFSGENISFWKVFAPESMRVSLVFRLGCIPHARSFTSDGAAGAPWESTDSFHETSGGRVADGHLDPNEVVDESVRLRFG
jgi:hypothetical protein